MKPFVRGLNNLDGNRVKLCMIPRSGSDRGYQSRFWPYLNGLTVDYMSDDLQLCRATKTDRENILLDVIGAYDLLLMQGLTEEGAARRLGLERTRDDLVRELDGETEKRLSTMQI